MNSSKIAFALAPALGLVLLSGLGSVAAAPPDAVMLAPAVAAEQQKIPSIRSLAPRSTVIIAGADSVDTALAHLRGTSLWHLWRTEEMRELRAGAEEQFHQAMGEMMMDLGVHEGEMPMPTGGVGFALYTVVDEKTGMPGPGMLFTADYGANAEKTSEIIDAAIKMAENEKDLEYEESDVRGRTVLSFVIPESALATDGDHGLHDPGDDDDTDEWDEWDEMGGMGGMGGMNPAESFMSSIDRVHFVRDGSLFMWSSNLDVLTTNLEICDGEKDHGGLAGRADFDAVMTQVGENDAYMAVLMENVPSLIAPMDEMGLTMMLTPMLKQVVGDVAGFGVGFKMNTQSAMVEETVAIYMPRGKAGLAKLMDVATPRDAPPSFVGANAVSYMSMNFDFSGVPTALNPVFQMMQMMMPPEMNGGGGPAPREMVDQICSTLGRRIHSVQTLDHPIDLEGSKQFVAIECPKPHEFEHLMEQFAPGMGMEGREFLGHRIYTAEIDLLGMLPMPGMPGDPGMPGLADMNMEPPAIGIGAGYLFLGPLHSVEQALRSSGDPDVESIALFDRFKRATGTLPSRHAVAWGYIDIVETIEATMSATRRQMQRAVVDAGDDFGDLGPDFEWWEGFDPKIFRRHIGPAAWEMTGDENGFVVKAFLLEPASAE